MCSCRETHAAGRFVHLQSIAPGTWLQRRIGSSITRLGDRFTFLDHLPLGDLPPGHTVRERAGASEARRNKLGHGDTDDHVFQCLLGLAQGDLGRDGIGDDGTRRLYGVGVIGGSALPVVFRIVEFLRGACAALGQYALTCQVLQCFLAGEPLVDDGGDLGNGVVCHVADEQLFADAVLLDEFLRLLFGDSQLDESHLSISIRPVALPAWRRPGREPIKGSPGFWPGRQCHDKPLMTLPLRFEPAVTCSPAPQRADDFDGPVSTAWCSRGATVTGTILGAAGPLPAAAQSFVSAAGCRRQDQGSAERLPHELSDRITDMIIIPDP